MPRIATTLASEWIAGEWEARKAITSTVGVTPSEYRRLSISPAARKPKPRSPT